MGADTCCTARHPNTLVSLLEQLPGDENIAVRQAVAQNPNTPASLLEQLAGDNNGDVAIVLARTLRDRPKS